MKDQNASTGKKRLIGLYKKKFRTRENLNHYSDKDFKAAEKKYLKHCLTRGQC